MHTLLAQYHTALTLTIVHILSNTKNTQLTTLTDNITTTATKV